MMFETENIANFANPMIMRIGMETITLSYEPGSDFAKALDELIRNSEGVCVVKRRRNENARIAIETMRQQSEQNGNSELSLEEINDEIHQARLERKALEA
jgi:hypothetical protein